MRLLIAISVLFTVNSALAQSKDVSASTAQGKPTTEDVCLDNCDLIFHLRVPLCRIHMGEDSRDVMGPTFDGQPVTQTEENCIEDALEEHLDCMKRCTGR
mgnify:CR=1 FL=1